MAEFEVGGVGTQYFIECIQTTIVDKGVTVPHYTAFAGAVDSMGRLSERQMDELKTATLVEARYAEDASKRSEELLTEWLLHEKRFRVRPVNPHG